MSVNSPNHCLHPFLHSWCEYGHKQVWGGMCRSKGSGGDVRAWNIGWRCGAGYDLSLRAIGKLQHRPWSLSVGGFEGQGVGGSGGVSGELGAAVEEAAVCEWWAAFSLLGLQAERWFGWGLKLKSSVVLALVATN